jgi:hypothetical protein
MEEEKRLYNFTSSENYKLIPMGSVPMSKEELVDFKTQNPGSKKRNKESGFTDLGKTYIKKKQNEILMGRASEVQVNTKPLKWGSLMEVVLFQKKELGLNYRMAHKLTIVHDTIKHFSGTPDLIELGVRIGEIKSFYPNNFCNLSVCLLKKDVDLFKKEFPKEYWQCVSNSILCDVDRAEIIVYMPYKDELIDIIEQVEQTNILEGNNLNPADYWFLQNDDIETLPYLPNDSKMKNINRFEFEVPTKDKTFLISRIKEAVELLVEV